MTAATAPASTTVTVATSTDALPKPKPNTASKKEYKAPVPSAPAAPQENGKTLVYVRCRSCNGGRAKVQFHHVVTMCIVFLLGYALLSLVLCVSSALDKEVSKTHVTLVKYNGLMQNYTSLQQKYNGLQKEMDTLRNKPEEPSNEKKHFTFFLRQAARIPEIETETQTETIIHKEVTTEKESEEVTSNTDEKEKNQINGPLFTELQQLYNRTIMRKIKLCVESPEKCP